MKPLRVSAVDAAWGGLGIILLWTLFASSSTTGDALGIRRFLTPDLGGRWRVAQRFTMNADEFSAIEIRAQAIGPVSGRFLLTLRDRTVPNERRTEIAAADFVGDDRYVFSFDPIHASQGHAFELDIAPVTTDPGRGVALRATKGNRLEDGGLVLENQERWASLAFQTYTPAGTLFRSLTQAVDPERPPRWLTLVGLLVSWIALRFVLQGLVRAATEHEPAATFNDAQVYAVGLRTAPASSPKASPPPPAVVP